MQYYKETPETILQTLNSSEKGLTQAEANHRISKEGYNELQTKLEINKLKLFLTQFKSFIIYILLFAVAFSLFLKEYVDAIIILIILLANACIGYFQELSAQKSLDALKQLSRIKAKVYRDEHLIEVDSKFLVKGDIIYLEAGDKIPADCRIIEQTNLKVEEAALTGESLPVKKQNERISKNAQIGDQKNMLFSSTTILEGVAKAIVVETAMKTEIGKITSLIRDTEDELTPLQKKLDKFGKKLGIAIIGVCVLIFLVFGVKEYLANGFTLAVLLNVFLIAVALAVAAVPEGLPAVVTIALSIGVKKLLKKKALVRKLSSVETLGSCNVICTDKTGTLTKNQMTVQRAWTLDSEAKISGVGYNPKGEISNKVNPLLFEIGAICNNSSLFKKNNVWTISGDPTEAALVVSAKKANVSFSTKREAEIPFDSSRKLMSVLSDGKVYTKGAPDKILEICSHVLKDGKKIALTKEMKEKISKQINSYSHEALRVLAFAYKESKKIEEKNLVFVGLQAMIDPPRADVKKSIATTKKAGIRVIMITGDYIETAKAIGKKIGIEGEALTGEDVSKLSDKELEVALENNTNIFARVIPEHKQRIVGALQSQGAIVAMTGDGVNDAPALKKANIGVAVGSGTDVAKEASDFVLLDDSFTNIVNAIEEGRGIYDNIQKTLMHLLSGNLSEVLIIFLAVLLGWNLPLTAIMLLWINLITDGAPALALAVDPYGKDIMQKKPKISHEGILPKKQLSFIFVLGIIASIIALTLFNNYSASLAHAQSVVFSFIVISEIILVFLIRKTYEVKMFSNGWLYLAIGVSLFLQALVMYTPLQELFKITPLGIEELLYVLSSGLILYVVGNLYSRLKN